MRVCLVWELGLGGAARHRTQSTLASIAIPVSSLAAVPLSRHRGFCRPMVGPGAVWWMLQLRACVLDLCLGRRLYDTLGNDVTIICHVHDVS
jgi:hypothetical protein